MAENPEPRTEAEKPTAPQRVKRIGKRLLVWYLVWLCLALVLQRRIVFPRHFVQTMENAGEEVAGLERNWLETEQGKVETWFVPGKGVTAAAPGPVVFFAHGNAEVIDDYPYVLQPYLDRGVSLALVEFRGYGRSQGSPSQKRLTEDAVEFYDLVASRPDVDKSRIVFHGRSIGTGVACSLANHRKPAALILQSPMSSVKRMMARYLIPPFLCLDPFDNASVVRSLDRPILIMHGNRDEVIPFSHGRGLSKLVNGCTFHEYDCGHNDFPMESRRYWNEIDAFLRAARIIASP